MSCSRELVTGTGTFRFSHPSTQQHLLVWRDRPKVVMVIKKLGSELLPEFLEVVEYLMEAEQMHVVVEPSMYEEAAAAGLSMDRLFTFTPEESGRLADHIDFVVCLGGDGVILHASSLFRQHIPPVVSFHLGSMGFLTNHPYPDFRQELRQVIYGCQKLATCSIDSQDMGPNGNSLGVMITLRMRLHCAIVRSGQSQPEQVYEVLNEIVLDRGSNSFLTNIEAYIQGRFITRVQADGIMLATPTGSTAYSVAAGGSMVHPNVQAILLTPICPHSLNFRPIILPDYVEMELRVPDSARVGAWVCFDGKQRQELQRGDSVFIKMSKNPVPTINREDLTTDWFESLERCFRWSNRMEQKPFQDDWVMQEAQAGGGTSSSRSSGSSYNGSGSGCGNDSGSNGVHQSSSRSSHASDNSSSRGGSGGSSSSYSTPGGIYSNSAGGAQAAVAAAAAVEAAAAAAEAAPAADSSGHSGSGGSSNSSSSAGVGVSMSSVAVIDGNVATAAPGSSKGLGVAGRSSSGMADMDVELHASASQ
ncbi:ATP-NAD kinase-like domain-containing protein [Scenedesmus sp. NREL 46B-D3]|nr:ATP-NAD kinase-like domain-containing protein [Scenedesmus sp. NREL 46B-D3]